MVARTRSSSMSPAAKFDIGADRKQGRYHDEETDRLLVHTHQP